MPMKVGALSPKRVELGQEREDPWHRIACHRGSGEKRCGSRKDGGRKVLRLRVAASPGDPGQLDDEALQLTDELPPRADEARVVKWVHLLVGDDSHRVPRQEIVQGHLADVLARTDARRQQEVDEQAIPPRTPFTGESPVRWTALAPSCLALELGPSPRVGWVPRPDPGTKDVACCVHPRDDARIMVREWIDAGDHPGKLGRGVHAIENWCRGQTEAVPESALRRVYP